MVSSIHVIQARVDDSRVAFEKMIRNEHMRGVPLLFLCNKQDMVGCLNVNQIREAFSDSASKMGSRDCSVRGVSALHGQGKEVSKYDISFSQKIAATKRLR